MLTIKNTITKMNNTFNGLISRLDKAKEAISEFKDMSEKFPKLKCKQKKEKRISKNYVTITKGVTEIPEEGDKREELFEGITAENLPKSMSSKSKTPNDTSKKLGAHQVR